MAAHGWTCKFCTYPENETEYLSCIMCNMPRNATEQEKCPVCYTDAQISGGQVNGYKCGVCDTVFQAKFPHKAVKNGKQGPAHGEAKDEKPSESAKHAVAVSSSADASCPICFSDLPPGNKGKCVTCGHYDAPASVPSAPPAPSVVPVPSAPPAPSVAHVPIISAPVAHVPVISAPIIHSSPAAVVSAPQEKKNGPVREERSMSSMPSGSVKSCVACFSEVTQAQGWVCPVCGYDNDPEAEKGPVEELIIVHSVPRKDGSDSDDDEPEKNLHRSVDSKQDAVVSPKCPICFTTNNVLYSQQSNIQCIVCDNFFTGTEQPPAPKIGAPHNVVSKTITKVKGQAAINRYEAISALHNTFVYDCPMCFAVLQVPRAEKDNFKCAVCGHFCSIKFREQKKKFIHARAANAKKEPNYKTMKKRGGELEWRKRANKINEVEALLYSPFAREMNLHRDVPKNCDCIDHDEYHAPLAETIKKFRKPTSAGDSGRKPSSAEKKRRNSDSDEDEKDHRKNSNEHLLEPGRGHLEVPGGGAGRSSASESKEKKPKKKEKKKKEEIPKEERLFSVCLTCQERHCEKCENVIHSHLERANHMRISFDLFQRCKALFLRIEEIGDMNDTKISCFRLEQVCPGFFPKVASRTIVAVLRQNVENFGTKYEMDFRTFLLEIAPRLPLQGAQVEQQESYLQRMDTDQLLNIHAQEFKKQKCWSRITQKPKVWLEQVLPGYFELWGSSIRKVEATHGAHIASYFYFSRWLFVLNFVVAVLYTGFIIFPWISMGQDTMTAPYNWWGVVVGYGLEGSIMYYGDYRYLKNPYVESYDNSNATVILGGHDFAQDRATFHSWGLQTLCRVNSSLLNDAGPGCGSSLGCYYQVEFAETVTDCQDFCRVSWCTGVQYTATRCELWRTPARDVTFSNTSSECFSKTYVDIGVTSLYPEDTAWVIMYAIMLLVTVLGIIQHLGRGHSSNLKEDPQFAFSNVVFTGIDFNVTHRGAMGLLRLNLVTTLDELIKYKEEEKLKHERKAHHDVDEEAERNAWRMFTGVMVCLALATVNWVGFYYMFEWEYRTLLRGVSPYKRPFFLMVCPLIVSGTKALLPKVFNQIISLEGYTRSGPIFRHYFARVYILALSYIAFFLLIGVYRDADTLLSEDKCLETENGILFYRIIVAEIVMETVVVLVYPAIRMQLRRVSAKLMSYHAVQGGVDRMRRTMHLRPSMRILQRDEGGHLDLQEVAQVGDNEEALQRNLQEQRLQHQKSRAILDQTHLEDPTKTVFNLTDNMVAIIYLQTLIFCGLLYCPALPLVGIVFHIVLFYTKLQQIAWFTKRSKRPMSVARQNRFFRIALVISLLTTILPFTTFLRSQPACGPFGQAGYATVADSFTQTVNAWPSAVVVVVGYLTNQMLLVMLLVCLIIWAAALVNRSKSISKEIASTAMRLKMETYERKKIIKEYNVSLGYDEVRGRDMIAAFITQLGPLGTKYIVPLKEYGFGDLVRLCKLNRDQLSGLLVRVQATQEEIEVILAAVDEKRLELM